MFFLPNFSLSFTLSGNLCKTLSPPTRTLMCPNFSVLHQSSQTIYTDMSIYTSTNPYFPLILSLHLVLLSHCHDPTQAFHPPLLPSPFRQTTHLMTRSMGTILYGATMQTHCKTHLRSVVHSHSACQSGMLRPCCRLTWHISPDQLTS